MRVATKTGEIVTLQSFDLRTCVLDLLEELQRTNPQCELALTGDTFMRVCLLNFDRETISRLNIK